MKIGRSMSERLRVSLLLLDMSKAGLEVGLRIVLTGPGSLRIATHPSYRGTSHYLDGGLSVNLSGSGYPSTLIRTTCCYRAWISGSSFATAPSYPKVCTSSR